MTGKDSAQRRAQGTGLETDRGDLVRQLRIPVYLTAGSDSM